MNNLFFHLEDTDFESGTLDTKLDWIKLCIRNKNFELGEINYIFCSDDYLLKINRKHLDHDYYTDIITFDYTEGKLLSGDLFISIDRVKENAQTEEVAFEDELDRVMVHGVLHLMGYKDHNQSERLKIRAEEDFCLTLRSKI